MAKILWDYEKGIRYKTPIKFCIVPPQLNAEVWFTRVLGLVKFWLLASPNGKKDKNGHQHELEVEQDWRLKGYIYWKVVNSIMTLDIWCVFVGQQVVKLKMVFPYLATLWFIKQKMDFGTQLFTSSVFSFYSEGSYRRMKQLILEIRSLSKKSLCNEGWGLAEFIMASEPDWAQWTKTSKWDKDGVMYLLATKVEGCLKESENT